MIRAVIDRYMLNIEGFGLPAPTPTVGAVYDCTITLQDRNAGGAGEKSAGYKLSPIASTVRSMSDSECAVDTKAVSNWEGGQ